MRLGQTAGRTHGSRAGAQGASRRARAVALAPCCRFRSTRLTVKAIGFDFGDDEDDSRSSKSPTKRSAKIGAIGTLAGSLLVYGHVVKGAVGEAFLQALAITQKYQASNKEVLAAYARFYSLLLQSGYDSWSDYVLDQVLLGRDNSFARAVAQGGLEPGAPVLKAVAYDLDVLQELALPLPQMAEMVGDAAPTAGSYWMEAASSVSIKSRKGARSLPASTPAPLPVVSAIDPHARSRFITRPATEPELAEWRNAISGKDAWSEAVPLLQQYYHLHGFGITSRNSTLRWNKGAFEEGPEGSASSTPGGGVPVAAAPLAPLSCLAAQRQQLDANTARHCEGAGGQHVLLAGPSGSGKSALLWDYTLAAGRDKGLRVVDVSGAELGNILEAARGCGRYPRLRFVLAADHVDLPMGRGAAAADLMAGLSGGGPSGWPTNTLLYMAATPTSTVTYDALVSRFGLVLSTRELDAEQFGATLREIAGPEADKLSDEDVAYAAEWANKSCGGLSVRAAAKYVGRARAGL